MKKLLSVLFLFTLLTMAAPNAEAAMADWQKGASIQPFSTTDFGSDQMKRILDSLRSAGATNVTLIIPYYQANLKSHELRPGWDTPNDDALAAAIDYAHQIGLKVMLKPHLETDNLEWRGTIDPSDRAAWYHSYGLMLERYARIARDHNVEDYCIGTELIRVASARVNGDNTQQWNNLIAKVRAIYSGKITYSANWSDEFEAIDFWPQLDYIGVSAYFDLSHASDGSVAELKKSWDVWRSTVIEPVQKKYNKPVVFTEIGYRSIDGAHRNPWDWGRDGSYSELAQSDAYQALFEYWKDYSWMQGVHFWRWELAAPPANSGDKGYSPQNKKAHHVMAWWWGGTVTSPPPAASPTPTPTSGPVSGTSWTSWGSATPENPAPHSGSSISVSVKNTSGTNVSNVLVDIEVQDVNGNRIHQEIFRSQPFAGGDTKTYSTYWGGGSAGTYKVKVGVFTDNWAHQYHWNNDLRTIAVGASAPPPQNQNPPPANTNNPPLASTLDIWWPTDGTHMRGLQPFKAILTNREVSTYDMFWQVDGDRLNIMFISPQDYPHKEGHVDLNSWTWRNGGPYTVNFVAKEKDGTLIQQKSVAIYKR